MFKEVILISVNRSGTNFVCSSLAALYGAAPFYEIFEVHGVHGLNRNHHIGQRLRRDYGYEFADERDPALIDEVHREPLRFFGSLSQAARSEGATFLSCKFFPTNEVRTQIIEEIISRPTARVIFLVRSRIEAFISLMKTQHFKAYAGLDTTEFRPEINYSYLVEYLKFNDDWYEQLFGRVRKHSIPHAILSYEEHVDAPALNVRERLLTVLRQMGVTTWQTNRPVAGWVVKQDKCRHWRDKISNSTALEAEIRAAGLLEYVEGRPLLDRTA